jgi:hypothetical protein
VRECHASILAYSPIGSTTIDLDQQQATSNKQQTEAACAGDAPEAGDADSRHAAEDDSGTM